MMSRIRKDLINEELTSQNEKYKNFNLHNSLISKLKNHYNCVEFVENSYDLDDDLTEEQRLHTCNWQEPYFEGNWSYSLQYVNNCALNNLRWLKRQNIGLKDRFYISNYTSEDNKEYIYIYFYGRDVLQVDYWFIFERKI